MNIKSRKTEQMYSVVVELTYIVEEDGVLAGGDGGAEGGGKAGLL